MKRWLATIFRWLEDRLDPRRRELLANEREAFAENLAARQRYHTELVALRSQLRELTPLPVVTADWNNELRAGLVDFLRSGAGHAMLARGRLIQHQLLVGTAQSAADPNAAKTWCQCLDWLESLSRASARSSEATEPGTVQSPDHDTPSSGDSALRERMSP